MIVRSNVLQSMIELNLCIINDGKQLPIQIKFQIPCTMSIRKLKRTYDDEAFYTGDSELRKAVTKQYRYEDASKIAVELYSKESLPNCTRRYGTSPTSSCRSEGNFSQRGKLKHCLRESETFYATVTVILFY